MICVVGFSAFLISQFIKKLSCSQDTIIQFCNYESLVLFIALQNVIFFSLGIKYFFMLAVIFCILKN